MLHEQGLRDLMQIIVLVIHPLFQDRFLSSGEDTTVFMSQEILQFEEVTTFKQKYFGIICYIIQLPLNPALLLQFHERQRISTEM